MMRLLRRVRGLPWVYHDGGRAAAGIKGMPGDCVARAIAIAAEVPYPDAVALIEQFARRERFRDGRRSDAHRGVFRPTDRRILASLGWTWHPTMFIGSGCQVHLRPGELPDEPRLIVQVSKHLVAVIDGVMYDTDDHSRGGTRCVYGYYTSPIEGIST